MTEENNAEHVEQAVAKEEATAAVADAASTQASALHEMMKAQNERLDFIHQDIGSQFGRVHERLDGVERQLATKADVEQVAEKEEAAAESAGEAPVQAAELVIEPVKDVSKPKEKEKHRARKGRRKR